MSPLVRRFCPIDAQAKKDVFVTAMQVGTAERYSEAERLDRLSDPNRTMALELATPSARENPP